MRRRWKVGLGIGGAVLLAVPSLALAWLFLRPGPRGARDTPRTVERAIATLSVERDSLRALVLSQASNSDLLTRHPNGDVLIGIPTPFMDALMRAVVVAWFDEVTVTLRDLQVKKAGDVRLRLGILGRQRVGSYDLTVVLNEVRGRLEVGEPELAFGGDRIEVGLPVQVAGGTVNATIAVAWRTRGLARQMCGDVATTKTVHGTIRPSAHVARGRIVLAARDGAIVADPDFPELAIRLFADPSKESLALLDSILSAQFGACGWAVEKADAEGRIIAVVDKGFLVRIPQRLFRPIRLPIGILTSVPVQDLDLALDVRPTGLAVTRATVWLGADVRIHPVAAAGDSLAIRLTPPPPRGNVRDTLQ